MQFFRPGRSISFLLASVVIFGCNDSSTPDTEQAVVKADASSNSKVDATKSVKTDSTDASSVKVVTTEFAIEAPSQLPTGWTSFDFSNLGDQVHFVAMYRLVDGKTIEDQLQHVAPAFEPLMQGLRSGELTKADIGPFLGENVPEWGFQMTWVGGAGLLSPGHTTQSTFYLEKPGIYLLECYVKSTDGKWHTLMGMMHQIEVIDEPNQQQEPTADHTLVVTNEGVTGPTEIKAGPQTFRVDIKDDPAGFMPYDLNLAKIADDTDLENLFFWMDWTNVGGLRAPAPVMFLGGSEHMRAGNHGFVTVDLKPGKYIWVSEINASQINLPFVVME